MGTEENENEPANLIDGPLSSPEDAEEEPMERVMASEASDTGIIESSEPTTTESEDQDRLEETAKFEEEIEQPSKKQKALRKKSAKPESKLLSNLQEEMKRYSNIGKNTDLTIRDIQRKIKDLDRKTNTKHNQIVRDLQRRVKELQRKIDRIDRSLRSTNRKQAARKVVSGRKGKDKISKKKSRKR
jgi:hypothetical protein